MFCSMKKNMKVFTKPKNSTLNYLARYPKFTRMGGTTYPTMYNKKNKGYSFEYT